jgi:hypothetical protein
MLLLCSSIIRVPAQPLFCTNPRRHLPALALTTNHDEFHCPTPGACQHVYGILSNSCPLNLMLQMLLTPALPQERTLGACPCWSSIVLVPAQLLFCITPGWHIPALGHLPNASPSSLSSANFDRFAKPQPGDTHSNVPWAPAHAASLVVHRPGPSPTPLLHQPRAAPPSAHAKCNPVNPQVSMYQLLLTPSLPP